MIGVNIDGSSVLDPRDDGLTHVNVYSQGRTELGRLLSNFAHTPFTGPDGEFASVEGYWYWLGAREHPMRERLRPLSGFAAKKFGRTLRAPDWPKGPEFQAKIRAALQAKAQQHPRIRKLLAECPLPLAHYYVFNGRARPAGGKWILREWDAIRDEVRRTPNR